MKKNHPSGSKSTQNIAGKLRKLTSLITHARDIETDTEALVNTLGEQHADPANYPVDARLDINLQHLREMLADSFDFQIREFSITASKRKAAVAFFAGMTDEEVIDTHVIGKLMLPPVAGLVFSSQQDEFAYLKNTLLTVASFSEVDEMKPAVQQLLTGDALLLIDDMPAFIVVKNKKMHHRAISEPEAESNVYAARDGFVEDLEINLTLIRRRLKNPNLIVKKITAGVRSSTDFALLYFRGIADLRLVCEVERRLKQIKLDVPVGIGSVAGLIEDHPYSIFPTMLPTERPDKFAAALIEGKVGILMDGSPFSLLAPATLVDFFQTSDDYNEKWAIASLIRITRYFSSLFAMATPAFFVAMTTFHPGLLPTPLAITIASARLGIPFPAFLEALVMEILLEVLQEAGIRLPKTIGPAVSIVGGLVIGEAAARAGLVSSPMVIVIAFTAIASFNIANYRLNLIVRLLRVPLMLLGTILGMFGVMIGLLALMAHLSIIDSFGVPYLAPVVPKNVRHFSDFKDTVVVAPPDRMDERPAYLKPIDHKRQQK
ncbi:bacillus/clostridium ger spore germination protein [Lucifera butyrica]|uniref:Bacillus/clostridium ger spore germination protein n=1 Tax=Lucifera butyrica TaxID=1351585 RepID=A0A498R8R1_9FIRM|nr:spore germination protein [Lucifera butyrica]VBB07310.1 bacillus/clostridium ger spore germination protein [Lucifera butyrica]